MSCNKLSGLYWLCSNLGPYWDRMTISKMEDRLVSLLRYELEIQKKIENDFDADVPEGLQTVSL